MLNFLRKNVALITASLALALSGCQMLGLDPIPNVYENADTVADKSLVTIKSFGAVQDTILTSCSDVDAGTTEADVCVGLITAEQTLRPAVTAAGRIGAEYADIDARIDAMGSDAPVEWLLAASEIAGQLAEAYDPIKADVENLIGRASSLAE